MVTQATSNRKAALGTPPPVEGRHHLEVQTETYLEDLFDRPIERCSESQTDGYSMDRPLSPIFIPTLTDDKESQAGESEIYDFDLGLKTEEGTPIDTGKVSNDTEMR